MTDREKTLRLQAMLEARRAIESIREGYYDDARERFTLAKFWLDEIESPKDRPDAPH